MPALKNIPVVKTSNFIGDTMDMAAASHFEEVVLVGHIGKLVKLAGGVMNTHSRTADCQIRSILENLIACGYQVPEILKRGLEITEKMLDEKEK